MNPMNTDPNANVQGQKYAFATASLIMGIACYVNLLGLEKAALAILFAWLALRTKPAPALGEHRRWAQTGLALGVGLWIMIPTVLMWKWDSLIDLVRKLQELGR